MAHPTEDGGSHPLTSTKSKHFQKNCQHTLLMIFELGLFNPPDQPGYDVSVNGLYQPGIFPSNDTKSRRFYEQAPASSPASSHRNRAPTPYKRPPPKGQPILIEPPPAQHSPPVRSLIDALPSTLRRIIESWSGDTEATQRLVLNKMIEALDANSQSIIRSFVDGTATLNITFLPQLLAPLCGLTGTLCSVVRNGNQSGVSSISCNLCSTSFESNAVQAFAHHLITCHWRIKVFTCYVSRCNKPFAWTQDRDRHEKTIHTAYRRKAYDIAVKQGPGHDRPKELTEAEKIYEAFKGYNMLENKWEN